MEKDLKLFFAPLQGYTDHIYRHLHQEYFGGIDAYYTPFIRLETNRLRNKDIRDVLPENNKVNKLIPQIIAANADELKVLINVISSYGYKEIDINMGCPFPMITNRQKGSGILPHPEKVKDILECISAYPDIHFSVKMRLGQEHAAEYKDLLPILNQAPLSHITLHPRTGKQQYKGCCDMESFRNFYTTCKHPLVYNGDILSTEDIKNIVQEFPKLHGVMIGRGILNSPFLPIEYKTGIEKNLSDKKATYKVFHNKLLSEYSQYMQGEHQLLSKIKKLWDYLLPEMDKKVKKRIVKSNSIKQYSEIINSFFSSDPD